MPNVRSSLSGTRTPWMRVMHAMWCSNRLHYREVRHEPETVREAYVDALDTEADTGGVVSFLPVAVIPLRDLLDPDKLRVIRDHAEICARMLDLGYAQLDPCDVVRAGDIRPSMAPGYPVLEPVSPAEVGKPVSGPVFCQVYRKVPGHE